MQCNRKLLFVFVTVVVIVILEVKCRFVNSVHRYCKKKGQQEKNCLSKKKNAKSDVNFTYEQEDRLNGIYCVMNTNRVPPYELVISLAGVPVGMHIDTGASFSIINEHTWNKLKSDCQGAHYVQLR